MKQVRKAITLFAAVMLLLLGGSLLAYASDDNSLADLGITTEGATVSPDFTGSTWTVDVTVPAGTTELQLDPVPSSDTATIADISGTTLNADGTGTVYITVRAASGAEFTYTLHVTSTGEAPAAPVQETDAPETQAPEPETEAQTQTEAPTEPATEDSRFVRVDRNTIQEAENTITNLKSDIAKYRDTISLYTKIMYGLIGVAVILLFIIINLILRKRDLKAELNDYRSLATNKQGGKQGKGSVMAAGAAGAAAAQTAQNRAAQQARRGQRPAQGQGTGAQAAQAQGAQRAQQANAGRGQSAGRAQSINAQARNAAGAQAPQGQISGQIRNGQISYNTPGPALDVTPQTSSHRERTLPEYQEEGRGIKAQATGQEQPVEDAGGASAQRPQTAGGETQAAPAQTASANRPARGAAPGKNVEVDMIEL